MAVARGIPRKGMSHIRTLSRLLGDSAGPERKYLRIAMLALQKVIRGRLRDNARNLMEDVSARLALVDAEFHTLLQSMRPDDGPPTARQAKPATTAQSRAGAAGARGDGRAAVRLRY